MYVLASGAALKFMGSFSFGSQWFWKLIVTILYNSHQECCAPKSSPGRCRPWWGELHFPLRKDFRVWGLIPAGGSFWSCVTESLNSSHPLLKVGFVMETSLESGDPAQWAGCRTWHALGAKFGFVGGTGWIITLTSAKAKECIWSQTLALLSSLSERACENRISGPQQHVFCVCALFLFLYQGSVFVLFWWKPHLFLTSSPADSCWSQNQVASWVRAEYSYLKRKGYKGRRKISILFYKISYLVFGYV